MSWFQRAVERGVKSAFKEALQPGGLFEQRIEAIFWDCMKERLDGLRKGATLTRLGFIWAMRLHFVAHGCSRAQAASLANSTLRDLLTDEKIKFGDPAYSWDREAARIVCNEYEIEHWEAASHGG